MLELLILEWFATKRMADNVEEGKEEEFEFDSNIGCTFGCELLAKYSLPCRHWIYTSIVKSCPLSLSLFYLHQHFDSLAVFYNCWAMIQDLELKTASRPSLANCYAGD